MIKGFSGGGEKLLKKRKFGKIAFSLKSASFYTPLASIVFRRGA